MTTIAFNFKDKEIAVDSRFTRGEMISTDNAQKVIKKNGVTFVLAGLSMSYTDLVDMWFNREIKKELQCSAFVISDGMVYDFGIDSDGEISQEVLTESLSKGSGEYWALAAMDFGCTAKQAIQYASKRCIYTGGRVRVIKVK